MAEEKGKTLSSEFTVQQPPRYDDSTTTAPASRKSKSRQIIIAVTVVCVVAILVGGFLGGAFVFRAAVKDIAKFHLELKDRESGHKVEETVESDTTDGIVKYHMKRPGVEQWVLNDFNKDITVYKVHTDGQTSCYVSPLNNTEASDPEAIRASLQDIATNPEEEQSFYQAADEPIKNPAYLGKQVTEMCDGHDIYWMNPSCEASAPSNVEHANSTSAAMPGHSREKRSIRCLYGCCARVCCCNNNLIRWWYNGRIIKCTFICHRRCPIYLARYC